MGRRFSAAEVSVLIGCSLQTINYWYAFKRQNIDTDNESIKKLIDLLPDYTQEGSRQTRYWSEDDIYKLVAFKNEIPKGRNGILGSVTQKSYHKKKEQKIK